MYLIKFSKQAEKDKQRLKAAGLEQKAKDLLNILMKNPFQNPPPYEKLVGNLRGNYSRRINIQHRSAKHRRIYGAFRLYVGRHRPRQAPVDTL